MKLAVSLAAALSAAALLGTASIAQDKPEIAFVVNGPSDFWKIMEAAVAKAQTELPDVTLSFRYPERADAAVQRRMMDDLVAAGVDAIAVSVVDPPTSTDAINAVAAQIPFFTFDSDAPQSNRVAYIGSSNLQLGTMAGELMKTAMAGKQGKCIGFVGLPGADNAKERIQGYNEAVKGTGLELIDVRGDDIDQTRARANVDDVLVANPDVNCMVGFYSYNSPRIYEALRDAG
ncbi:MAG TPA: substrate-binding domain-containing protein, partial [Alphaproteobacteria bacterium]|nr:substrate-binding domain-containing protein [Alphaproteobacteria bacterium]